MSLVSFLVGLLAVLPALFSSSIGRRRHLENAEKYLRIRDMLFPAGESSFVFDSDSATYSELQLAARYHIFKDEVQSNHFPVSNTLYFVQLISVSVYNAYLIGSFSPSDINSLSVGDCAQIVGIIAVSLLSFYLVVARRAQLQFAALRKSEDPKSSDIILDTAVDNQSGDISIPIVCALMLQLVFRSMGNTPSIIVVMATSAASAVVTFIHSVRRDAKREGDCWHYQNKQEH